MKLVTEADVRMGGLYRDIREDIVEKLMEWIRINCEQTNKVRSDWRIVETIFDRKHYGAPTAYFWKHVAECKDHGIGDYVGEGEFIVAAIRLGYTVKDLRPRKSGAYLNMRWNKKDTTRNSSDLCGCEATVKADT